MNRSPQINRIYPVLPNCDNVLAERKQFDTNPLNSESNVAEVQNENCEPRTNTNYLATRL